MRRIARFILLKPILWAAAKFASKPDRVRIFKALNDLFTTIVKEPGKKGIVIPFDCQTGRFIIFSDQHKGARNGADDFAAAGQNYLNALAYYHENEFTFINLGDSEELWENLLFKVKKHNKKEFEAEKKFLETNRYIKIFGNHDLFWDNDPLAWWHLKNIYGQKVRIDEGIVLKTSIRTASNKSELTLFLTHGHQGDASSDGNWFSKFFVARIWAPLQAFLRINPNTPAYDAVKKTLHNQIMYEWSAAQGNIILITGHTHQPVFASLTHLERLYKEFQLAEKSNDLAKQNELSLEIRKREKQFTAVSIDYMTMKPTYFNTGCCCFSDGDITGIEIADGSIRLIKWSKAANREVLETSLLNNLI